MTSLFVVDGPNLYNDAGRFLTKDAPSTAGPSVLKEYFRDWFDVDRLVGETLAFSETEHPPKTLGTVIFHSRKKLGEKPYELDGTEAMDFWARQGACPNTSTMLVEVPGAPSGKETGVDTSIIVYLFETMDQWQSVTLLTNDADHVPAVWSLRRRGKRVLCSSPTSEVSRPLVQACQHFVKWNLDFLHADRDLFELLVPGGRMDKFFQRMVGKNPKIRVQYETVCLSVDGAPDDVLGEVRREVVDGTHLQADNAPGHGIGNVIALRPKRGSAESGLRRGLQRHWDSFRTAFWHPRFLA